MLRLNYGQYKSMEGHAMAVYPQECCGLIFGLLRSGGDRLTSVQQDRQAMEIWPVANAWSPAVEVAHQQLVSTSAPSDAVGLSGTAHSQQDRFYIDPRDLLKAQKYARSQGWQIIGNYHSHPDHVAEPSERDRQAAWPEYSYLILSVCAGRVTDCQSWRLTDSQQFEPEPWQL